MTAAHIFPTIGIVPEKSSNGWDFADGHALGRVFDLTKVREGDILHCRRSGLFARMIRWAVGSWGSHDALLVKLGNHWWVGDAVHPQARLTCLIDYERDILAGTLEVRVYRPWDGTEIIGREAAHWWKQNVLGRYYDWGAFPRLLAKAIVGDLFPWPAGWEFAFYCTEGVMQAWRHATTCAGMPVGMNYWAKNSPTPRTTEKRVEDGLLVEVAGVAKK